MKLDKLVVLTLAVFVALCGAMIALRASYPAPVSPSFSQKEIKSLCAANGQPCVAYDPKWSMETPMRYLLASEQRSFIARQSEMWSVGSDIQLVYEDGSSKALKLEPQGLRFFNESVASQLIAVTVVFGMGLTLIAYVRRTTEVWLAFAMCSGYSLFMLMRFWYTDRLWVQPSAHWWAAMSVFKLGVVVCAASALSIVWRLGMGSKGAGLLYSCLVSLAAVVAVHAMGVIDSVFLGYRLPTLLCLLAIVGVGMLSAFFSVPRAVRHSLLSDKEALAAKTHRTRTITWVVVLGFIPALVTNAVWAFAPQLNVVANLNNFAVATTGVSLLILVARASEYSVQRYWWSLWLVMIASSASILLAGMFTSLTNVSLGNAMLLSIVAASWFVFFIRHWLSRWLLGEPVVVERIVPELIALTGLGSAQAHQRWQEIARHAFDAHSSMHLAEVNSLVTIREQGDVLVVPDLSGQASLALLGASQFSRAFNQSDVQAAQTLWSLARQSLDAKEHVALGALRERQRIAADLHDDIGGKLLHLAGSGGKEGDYARQTLDDLRTITRGLSGESKPLSELLADIQFALGQRAERASVDFVADIALDDREQALLDAHQSTVLVSLCSELLRNALQSALVKRVSFEFRIRSGQVILGMKNDGEMTDPSQWRSGLGLTSVRRRVNDLGGTCQWVAQSTGGVEFCAQWLAGPWLDGVK